MEKKKTRITIYCLKKYSLTIKVKVWKKIYYANNNHKKVSMAILISDEQVFRAKNITRIKKVIS